MLDDEDHWSRALSDFMEGYNEKLQEWLNREHSTSGTPLVMFLKISWLFFTST